MEMADLIAINKADGNNIEKAQMASRQYKNALHLFPKKESGWEPQVLTCSAIKKTGITEIWSEIEKYKKRTMNNKYFSQQRNAQSIFWMHETIQEQMKRAFYQHPAMKKDLKEFEQLVLKNNLSPFIAAGKLLDRYSRLIH